VEKDQTSGAKSRRENEIGCFENSGKAAPFDFTKLYLPDIGATIPAPSLSRR
jgi:hypothetical protein